MLFMIEDGRWIVESPDHWLRIVIQPRRSQEGSATRMTLRAEPMPLLELKPERLPGAAPAMAWVWDGTPEHAKTIVLRILNALRIHLAPNDSLSLTTNKWRSRIQVKLNQSSAADAKVAQTQRA